MQLLDIPHFNHKEDNVMEQKKYASKASLKGWLKKYFG